MSAEEERLRAALDEAQRARQKAEEASSARIERLRQLVDEQARRAAFDASCVTSMAAGTPAGVLIVDEDQRVRQINERYCQLFQLKASPDSLVGMSFAGAEENARGLFVDPEEYVHRLKEVRESPDPIIGDPLQLRAGQLVYRDYFPILVDDRKKGELYLFRIPTPGQPIEESPPSFRLEQQVRELERLGQGLLHFSEGPYGPADLLKSVADEMKSSALEKGLILATETDAGLPATVLGDESRIRQLLIQLVENAIKFTPQGKIVIRAARPTSGDPGADSTAEQDILFQVEDTGIGMPHRAISKVFDRNYQVDPETPGTGLGLFFCRDMVHLMGGRIGADSLEGFGSRLHFSVPQTVLSDDVPNAPPPAPVSRFSLPPLPPEPASILLVEDDASNRQMITRVLQHAGFRVEALQDGQRALLRLYEHKYDALVTDISMPGMDGIDLVTALRAHEMKNAGPRTPTVVVSACDVAENQLRCRRAGVDVFLTKPVKSHTLCMAVAKAIQHGAQVLVFDEAGTTRLRLEQMLRDYPVSLEISGAASYDETIALCRRRRFSLVFLASPSPDQNGVSNLLHEIRGMSGLLNVPVLLCCPAPNDPDAAREMAARAQELGFTSLLAIPVEQESLYRTLRNHLRSSTVIDAGGPLTTAATERSLRALGRPPIGFR